MFIDWRSEAEHWAQTVYFCAAVNTLPAVLFILHHAPSLKASWERCKCMMTMIVGALCENSLFHERLLPLEVSVGLSWEPCFPRWCPSLRSPRANPSSDLSEVRPFGASSSDESNVVEDQLRAKVWWQLQHKMETGGGGEWLQGRNGLHQMDACKQDFKPNHPYLWIVYLCRYNHGEIKNSA